MGIRAHSAFERIPTRAERLRVHDDRPLAVRPCGQGVPHWGGLCCQHRVAHARRYVVHVRPVDAVQVHPQGILLGGVVQGREEDVEEPPAACGGGRMGEAGGRAGGWEREDVVGSLCAERLVAWGMKAAGGSQVQLPAARPRQWC